MSPRKQPLSLYQLSIRKSLSLINDGCCAIGNMWPEIGFKEYKRKVYNLKSFLMAKLPPSVFEALCLERSYYRRSRGDPYTQLEVLIHPKMTIFRKACVDEGISQYFWMKTLLQHSFSRLVSLDLSYVCTDEILEIITTKCLRLQELNIRSRFDLCKSDKKFSGFISHVSDASLCCLRNLKQLRILSMDQPRNENSNLVGQCVTQAGIIKLLCDLPYLEELNIQSPSYIGGILMGAETGIGPLSLRKVNCHSASAEDIRKLIKICPRLEELSVVISLDNDDNSIIDVITASGLRLNVLKMSVCFKNFESLQRLLQVQCKYVTHFKIWDYMSTININSIVHIGLCCPNLVSLCLITGSNDLFIPSSFERPANIFSELQSLKLRCETNFELEDIMLFFLECTKKLSKLVLKCHTEMDQFLLYLVNNGYLSNISNLDLQDTEKVSKYVIIKIIESCNKLTNLRVNLEANDKIQIVKYIRKNNYDLNFD